MDVINAINQRRSFRILAKTPIPPTLIEELALSATLAPSCFNKQPWRFVFVSEEGILNQLFDIMSPGNEWTRDASMIIAVFSRKQDDCLIKNREYFLFDTGMAVGFLMLRATELGWVSHAIAGYDESAAKRILQIPNEMTLITLIIISKKGDQPSSWVSQKNIAGEPNRPPRFPLSQFVHYNQYKQSPDY